MELMLIRRLFHLALMIQAFVEWQMKRHINMLKIRLGQRHWKDINNMELNINSLMILQNKEVLYSCILMFNIRMWLVQTDKELLRFHLQNKRLILIIGKKHSIFLDHLLFLIQVVIIIVNYYHLLELLNGFMLIH